MENNKTLFENNLKLASETVLSAEIAVEILNKHHSEIVNIKSKDMLEQIMEYLIIKLGEANWMCPHVNLFDRMYISSRIERSNARSFSFGVRGIPLITISETTRTAKAHRQLSKDQILTLISSWSDFKELLDEKIKEEVKRRSDQAKKEVRRIEYENERLKQWEV